MGFLMLGIFALNVEGVSGGIIQMINHGVTTGALFLLVGIIYERRHTREIAALKGLSTTIPVFAVFFGITMFSSIGLPGLNGFVGEFLILVSALLELKPRGLFEDEAAELSELEPEEAAEELARRLAEYRRMKEAAGWLAERLSSERDRFFRVGPAALAPQPGRRLAPQDPEQLANVVRLLAAEPPTVSLAHMELRFPPVAQFLERFRALLARRSVFDFDAELDGLSRAEQAIAFLALLDLRRSDEIRISQAAPFAPIRVSRVEQESAAVNERTPAWTVRSA